MNTYHIHYYGLLADQRGLSQEVITHNASTPAAVYEYLLAQHSFSIEPRYLRAAVNDEFAPWNRTLNDHDSISFLPPMSGG